MPLVSKLLFQPQNQCFRSMFSLRHRPLCPNLGHLMAILKDNGILNWAFCESSVCVLKENICVFPTHTKEIIAPLCNSAFIFLIPFADKQSYGFWEGLWSYVCFLKPLAPPKRWESERSKGHQKREEERWELGQDQSEINNQVTVSCVLIIYHVSYCAHNFEGIFLKYIDH